MKEVPNPDGQSTIQSLVSRVSSESVNHLANPHAITSANLQNDFGGNEEDEKRVLYQVYQR